VETQAQEKEVSVTQAQYDEIARWRRLYFGSQDGRAVLHRMLESYGLMPRTSVLLQQRYDEPDKVVGVKSPDKSWREMVDDPGPNLRLLIQGFFLLQQLGVLVEDNYGHLIDAMAALPMPEIKE
jgi:hypothetical protein